MTYDEAVEALDKLVADIKQLSKRKNAPIEALIKILEGITTLYDKLEQENKETKE